MALLILNYQSAELLSYAKQNPNKPLPTIVTLFTIKVKNVGLIVLTYKTYLPTPLWQSNTLENLS